MARAASLRNASLGRFWPGDSVVHTLDPRVKLCSLGLWTVAIVLASRWWVTAALFLLIAAAYRAARLPRGAAGAVLRPVLPVLAVLAVSQLLFGYQDPAMPGADIGVLEVGAADVSLGRVIGAAIAIVRLLSLVMLVGLLTATTSASALASGMERLLLPLNRIGLPGHELALTGAIALRFLPILGEELEAVQRAQLARDITGGPERPWQLARNLRRTAALVVPLFADALQRVDEISTALLARCYQGGRGRTYMRELRLNAKDLISLAISVGLLVIVVVL